MSIQSEAEWQGMKNVSRAVGETLRKMREYARPGITTIELDEYGAAILAGYGARSAPKLTYGFPGWTCISVNHEVAHGIPSATRRLSEGDLINIDVSAELDGFWADNGGSFVLGADLYGRQNLVDASQAILHKAIRNIRAGVKIADIGRLIQTEARKRGYRVIKNLVGHGVGRSLHEAPLEIPCYYDRLLRGRFHKHAVVAIETFISTHAHIAHEMEDGWTLAATDGSFVAQHEHTIVITESESIILTAANGI